MAAKEDTQGWRVFSYIEDYPLKMRPETYQYNLEAVRKVPLEQRKQSLQLKKQADEALKKGDKAAAEQLYQQAFDTNPAFYDDYRFRAEQAAARKDYKLEVQMYGNYLKYSDSSKYYKLRGFGRNTLYPGDLLRPNILCALYRRKV